MGDPERQSLQTPEISDTDRSRPSDTWSRSDAAIGAFESAWQRGEKPAIADFLPGDTALDDRHRELLRELVQIDLEYRLKSGEAVRVEECLAAWPALAGDRAAALELIAAECSLRRRNEPELSLNDYLRRFPQFADEIRARWSEAGTMTIRRSRAPELRCPHCQAAIAAADAGHADLVCPACGSSFKIERERPLSAAPRQPPKFGKFELLEPLGRGAFGAVYRARDTQLGRLVAVKIPRHGRFANEDDEDRFVREARMAAGLHHPGIVPVYEVGRTDEFPFIVTELIEGQTLADALDGPRLGYRESARLVIEIAAALHHAHESGIVHRDLKPSNVMLEGDERRVRVMDFGLARRDAGEVTVTVEGDVLGTPAYMSPEQATGQGHQADRRADVYSLGVMLYEMLTGERPFRGNPRMMLQQVVHDEPPSPRTFDSHLPRDLETICLKCLTKSPAHRYATCQDLADDLGRWLRREPILARPVGPAGRASRWVRRNPVVAALCGAVAAALFIGTIVSTYFAIQSRGNASVAEANLRLAEANAAEAQANAARAQRSADEATKNARLADERAAEAQANAQRAEQEKSRANREAQQAIAVADFLGYLFKGADPLELSGAPGGGKANATEATARELLDRGVELAARSDNPPLVRAVMLDTLGEIERSHFNYDAAERLLKEALGLREAQLSDDDPDIAASLFHYGRLSYDRGGFVEAEPYLQRAKQIYLDRFGPDDSNVADVELTLGWLKISQGGHDEDSEILFRDALRIRIKSLDSSSPAVAAAQLGLAAILLTRHKDAEGILLATQALSKLPGGDSFSVAIVKYMRARSARFARRFDEAEKLHQEALEAARRFLGPRHFITLMAEGDLASMLYEKGDAAAEKLMRDVLNVARQSPLVGHPEMIKAMFRSADYLRARGELKEPEALYREVLDYCRLRGRPPDPLALERLADVLRQQGREEEAAAVLAKPSEGAK